MRKLFILIALIGFCFTANAQFMLGKGLDDILSKYQRDSHFRLTALRTPKGTVVPNLKITSVVQMRDTGDSENSIITYKELTTGDLYTFFLVNDRCITFQHTYQSNAVQRTVIKLNNSYNRIPTSESTTLKWQPTDGSFEVALIKYSNLPYYDVQYSIK